MVVGRSYERQWRDACDDLRTIESTATLDRITADRAAMVQSRAVLKEKERQLRSQNEAEHMSLINKDESEEQARRRRASLDIKRTLDLQVERKKSEAETRAAQRQREEREELRRLARLEQEARDAARRSKDKATKDGEGLLSAMRLRAQNAEARGEEEKEQNLILLRHASTLGSKKERAEEVRKRADRDAAADYARFLQEEATLEEEKERTLDRIRAAETRRITQRNDEKLAANAEMKRQWRTQVRTALGLGAALPSILRSGRCDHVHFWILVSTRDRWTSRDKSRYAGNTPRRSRRAGKRSERSPPRAPRCGGPRRRTRRAPRGRRRRGWRRCGKTGRRSTRGPGSRRSATGKSSSRGGASRTAGGSSRTG